VVRVILVGDDEIIAEGLNGILAPHRDRAELVGHALHTEELVEVVNGLGADVVLVELPLVSGLDLMIEKLPFRLVIFTDDADERRLFEALGLDSSGDLLVANALGNSGAR
jgi:DNA-binding NarL/FixJ family response regulator